MLPKENRLDLKRKFSYLKRSGKTYKSPFFVALYHPTTGPVSTVGFVLSKKLGTAVMRNRMRRILAAAFTSQLNLLPARFEIAIVGRIALEGRKSTDVATETAKFVSFLLRNEL